MAMAQGYQNCWEYWDCPKELQVQCPVFNLDEGRKCRLYTDNLKVFDWARPRRDFDSCLDCSWYQRMEKEEFVN